MEHWKIKHFIFFVHCLHLVNSFNCYIGRDSNYQESTCFSCQSVSCMCMTGIPVQQLINSGEFDTDIYGSRSPFVKNHDGRAISRLPTYSDNVLGGRSQRQLYSPEYAIPSSTIRPRILFPTPSPSTPSRFLAPVPVLRECWPNPHQAESPGCSVQKYRGNWYNICRCDTELCNSSISLQHGRVLQMISFILICLSYCYHVF